MAHKFVGFEEANAVDYGAATSDIVTTDRILTTCHDWYLSFLSDQLM